MTEGENRNRMSAGGDQQATEVEGVSMSVQDIIQATVQAITMRNSWVNATKLSNKEISFLLPEFDGKMELCDATAWIQRLNSKQRTLSWETNWSHELGTIQELNTYPCPGLN